MSLTSYRAAPPRANMKPTLKTNQLRATNQICTQMASTMCGAKNKTPAARAGVLFDEYRFDELIIRPGNDLLSHALRHSTIGAGDFHGRVRDGIGCRFSAMVTRSYNKPKSSKRHRGSGFITARHALRMCFRPNAKAIESRNQDRTCY